MEPIYQCAGRKRGTEAIWPGGPRVTVFRPCGQAARWRVFNPNRYSSSLPPGWCTAHAAQLLRAHDGMTCPVRIPLAEAKLRAESTWMTGGGMCAYDRIRAANTALRDHDRTHACRTVEGSDLGGETIR